ncbi:MAG TPA: glycosyltransferase family 4 protein [Gemmatimonadaceae bacterium]|jgi:colanic acid biosynthesis glycosyl transferase WcaI
MRILVLSLYYDPDVCQSNGPIIRAICDDLASAGHEVTVLTSFPHYNRDEVWPEYKGRLFQRDKVGAVRVIRSYIHVSANRTPLARILNYLSFNISSSIAGLRAGRHDVIFAMSPPLTIGLTAWLLGSIYGIPYTYNLQDIWPEVAVKLGMLRGASTIRFFESMERFIYRYAAQIFAISSEFRENLLRKGVDESKVQVIPNFVDTARITPMSRDNRFAHEHGLVGKFVALYAGNVGLSQGLEVILDAAEALRAESDILFLIVGSGGLRDRLIADAAKRELTNVRFLPLQPEEDVPLLYGSADVGLIPLKKGIAESSVPSKTYTIMAAARPYIAGVDEDSNVWRLTVDAQCGVCVPPEDSSTLVNAILRLRVDPEERRRMGKAGREYVERHFAREAVTARYRAGLEAVVSRE